ncbi:type II toxin-antitoxin system Phd/YefM family antitoxin [Nocardia rhizosphaerihabitans]|uniref:type II toxin-antitoxin system Phd/YefM family antitoxin n=1 Tax=Nocardia rhizosphaerihabitans TaxID=1691570 RepID=UPI00367248F3
MARKDGERSFDVAWPLADAKARFSELIDTVEREGPQVISRHGREVAVIVPVEQWRRATARTGTLAEFFAASPLAELTGDELRLFDREHSDPDHRAVEL